MNDRDIMQQALAACKEERALRERLAQPEQEQWDAIPDAFNEWWNADYDDTGNPFRKDSPAYWAWSGWKAASKQPAQREPDAYGYASRLAVAIWEQHYKDVAPQWKPLDDLMGVLTQIDNMTTGLTIKRLNDAVLAEREGCAALCDQLSDSSRDLRFGTAIRART